MLAKRIFDSCQRRREYHLVYYVAYFHKDPDCLHFLFAVVKPTFPHGGIIVFLLLVLNVKSIFGGWMFNCFRCL